MFDHVRRDTNTKIPGICCNWVQQLGAATVHTAHTWYAVSRPPKCSPKIWPAAPGGAKDPQKGNDRMASNEERLNLLTDIKWLHT